MAESTTSGDMLALVQDGRAALMAGDTYTARQCFRQALTVNPDQVDALIGMAGSLRAYREKREYLLRALGIDPSNVEAKAILTQVESRLAAGEVLAPSGIQVGDPERNTPTARASAYVNGNTTANPITLFCYRHPRRETGLRCTSCDRPICADCVRPAAVGQLCPECARSRRPVNYQVSAVNLATSGIIALVYGILISILAGFLLGMAGFMGFFLAIILGPTAGEMLIRLLERVNRKRGRAIQIAVGICYGLGAVPVVLSFFSLGVILFTIAAIATAITRLR
ncbi:MAG: hypothetical protein HGA19_17345 [Oscillochloris sp.]|nr:hypothetical protein [Oscillochloris sp.]